MSLQRFTRAIKKRFGKYNADSTARRDLVFGWITITGKLKNIRLSSEITLVQQDEDGESNHRSFNLEPESFLNNHREDYDGLSYAPTKKELTGDACFDEWNKIYLDVPKDKKRYEWNDKNPLENELTKIDSIEVYIKAIRDEDMSNLVRTGSCSGSTAYLYVPENTFDDIVHLVSQPNITPEIELTIQCWHYDLSGYFEIYFDSEKSISESAKAELTNLNVEKVISSEDGEPLNKYLQLILINLSELQLSVFILVVIAAIIAIKLLFF